MFGAFCTKMGPQYAPPGLAELGRWANAGPGPGLALPEATISRPNLSIYQVTGRVSVTPVSGARHAYAMWPHVRRSFGTTGLTVTLYSVKVINQHWMSRVLPSTGPSKFHHPDLCKLYLGSCRLGRA